MKDCSLPKRVSTFIQWNIYNIDYNKQSQKARPVPNWKQFFSEVWKDLAYTK